MRGIPQESLETLPQAAPAGSICSCCSGQPVVASDPSWYLAPACGFLEAPPSLAAHHRSAVPGSIPPHWAMVRDAMLHTQVPAEWTAKSLLAEVPLRYHPWTLPIETLWCQCGLRDQGTRLEQRQVCVVKRHFRLPLEGFAEL